MEFAPKQLESIIESTARLNIWDGSVRSGKTVAANHRWLEYVINGPAGDLFMCGKTERTLKRNIINPLKELLGDDLRYVQGEGEVYIGGRRIYIVGANDGRAEDKIRGSTIAGALADEITLYPEGFFKMLLSRLSVRGAKLFGTTNPDSPYHYLKTEYFDRADKLNIKIFRFTIDDNIFLDPDYVQALKLEYTGLFYKRFILGLWVLAEGAIYDMWDEDRHVVEAGSFPDHIAAVDYGTANPCTFGIYGFKKQPPVHLLAEYYHDGRQKRQKTDSEYADDLESFLAGYHNIPVYVDPSAASFIVECKKRGLNIRSAKNDVIDGIRFVASLLSRDLYQVDRSCTKTQLEYSAYVWDPKAQKRGEDKPIKEHDHTCDRDRYALYSHFGKGSRVISGAKQIN